MNAAFLRPALLPAIALLTTGTIAQSGKKGVIACFERYQQAILTDRGADAADEVDSRTIAYYDKVLTLVHTADSTATDDLPLMDKLFVLLMRAEASAEELARMKDGRGVFIYAVQNGMVSKGSVAGASVKDVTLKGDFATSILVVNGNEAPFGFDFYLENGAWRIDLTSIFMIASLGFQQAIDNSGMGTNEFLVMTIKTAIGKDPGNSIWSVK